MTGWVLFRSDSLDHAIHYITRLYGLAPFDAASAVPAFLLMFPPPKACAVCWSAAPSQSCRGQTARSGTLDRHGCAGRSRMFLRHHYLPHRRRDHRGEQGERLSVLPFLNPRCDAGGRKSDGSRLRQLHDRPERSTRAIRAFNLILAFSLFLLLCLPASQRLLSMGGGNASAGKSCTAAAASAPDTGEYHGQAASGLAEAVCRAKSRAANDLDPGYSSKPSCGWFPCQPNINYIRMPVLGYYPLDTIRRLNYDVAHRTRIETSYRIAARRLRILAGALDRHGVTLLVVPPPPKVRVYPEYAPIVPDALPTIFWNRPHPTAMCWNAMASRCRISASAGRSQGIGALALLRQDGVPLEFQYRMHGRRHDRRAPGNHERSDL